MPNKKIIFIYPSMHPGGVPKRVILFASILKENNCDVWVACKNGSLVNKIKELNIGLIDLPKSFQSGNNFKGLIAYLSSILLLLFRIRKIKPDLLVNDSRFTAPIAKLITSVYRIKYYSVAHGSYEGFSFLKKWVWGEKILAVSETTKLTLINDFNLPSKRIKVIKNSIRPLREPDFTTKEEFLNNYKIKDKVIISTITRFDNIKNVFMTLEAWNKIYRDECNTILLIIGHGPLEAKVRDYIEKNDLSARTLLLNNISDVSVIVSISKFIMLTSKREGLPTVVLEAFSLGKPVLATDVIGTNEIVVDGKNGYLVPLTNIKLCSERMRFLIHMESASYKSISISAYDTYHNDFDFSAYKNKILDYFIN